MTTTTLLYEYFYRCVFFVVVGVSDLIEWISAFTNVPTILCLLVFLTVFVWAYIKVRYPFWNLQPVLHTYDLHRRYFLYTPYVVVPTSAAAAAAADPSSLNSSSTVDAFLAVQKRLQLHRQHRFFDGERVKTGRYLDHEDAITVETAEFLQTHRMSSDHMFCKLSPRILRMLMTGYSDPVLVSLCRSSTTIGDSQPQPHPRPLLLGCMFARPLRVFWMRSSAPSLVRNVYFWDCMCVSRNLTVRQQNDVVRRLVQTHASNQAMMHPRIEVSLFRREIELCDGVVPFVRYVRSVICLGKKTTKTPPPPPPNLPADLLLYAVRRDNIHVLADLFGGAGGSGSGGSGMIFEKGGFDFVAVPNLPAAQAAIEASHLFVYFLANPADGNTPLAFYFLANAHLQYEDLVTDNGAGDCDTLHLLASVRTIASPLFVVGFLHALHQTRLLFPTFGVLWIDGGSHNASILRHCCEEWRNNDRVDSVQCAYYFYNYVVPQSPLIADQCFILIH